MLNRIYFKFAKNVGNKDLLERTGDLCLKLARKSFGFCKIKLIKDQTKINQIRAHAGQIFLFLLTLPISSLASLTGMTLIALSETHKRKFLKCLNDSKLVKPAQTTQSQINESTKKEVEVDKAECVKYLDKLSTLCASRHEIKSCWHYDFLLLPQLTVTHINGFWPERKQLSNLVLECQNDDEAYFIPTKSFEHALENSEHAIDPEKSEELSFLGESLRAGFGSGKRILVTRLHNAMHCVAAGFSEDGTFKIIDSMKGTTVDIKKITKHLNEAKIKNAKGQIIHFKGEYINTPIQKDGNECIRFATLYCYQMFKRKDLNAFEEVNGAFVQGKLKKYEDYKKIDGSKKIRRVKSDGKDIYLDFMHSWCYRAFGLLVDDWRDINLKMFSDRSLFTQEKENNKAILFLTNSSIDFPEDVDLETKQFDTVLTAQGVDVKIKTVEDLPSSQEIALPQDISALTFRDLFSLSPNPLFLYFAKNHAMPRLFTLLPGQTLNTVFPDGDRMKIGTPT